MRTLINQPIILRMTQLGAEEAARLRESYLNVMSYYFKDASLNRTKLECIRRWGIDMGIPESEIQFIYQNPDSVEFEPPHTRLEGIEQVYDLVYFFYLDGIVEDVELEIMMDYAKVLKLAPGVVGDVLKAIDTAPGDGRTPASVREELKSILEERED